MDVRNSLDSHTDGNGVKLITFIVDCCSFISWSLCSSMRLMLYMWELGDIYEVFLFMLMIFRRFELAWQTTNDHPRSLRISSMYLNRCLRTFATSPSIHKFSIYSLPPFSVKMFFMTLSKILHPTTQHEWPLMWIKGWKFQCQSRILLPSQCVRT